MRLLPLAALRRDREQEDLQGAEWNWGRHGWCRRWLRSREITSKDDLSKPVIRDHIRVTNAADNANRRIPVPESWVHPRDVNRCPPGREAIGWPTGPVRLCSSVRMQELHMFTVISFVCRLKINHKRDALCFPARTVSRDAISTI